MNRRQRIVVAFLMATTLTLLGHAEFRRLEAGRLFAISFALGSGSIAGRS